MFHKLILCDLVHSAELSTVISALLISFLLILSLITVSFTIVICRMKFREKIAETRNRSTSVQNKEGNVMKTDVAVVLNQAYALHNISRCFEVQNEVNTVFHKAGNEEPVYELVK